MRPGQHRETARVILHNDAGQVFLLLTHFDPEVGLPPRWITPGGGIDVGETPMEAAVRELFEETGLRVDSYSLGEQIWQTSGRWDWSDGNFHTYVDYFFKLRVEHFELDTSGWTKDEQRDVLEYRWWSIAELISSTEQIGPHGLSDYLKDHFSNHH
jgi:8-oxo-dGTP pyrophosphatase MutT (NUDIX family)